MYIKNFNILTLACSTTIINQYENNINGEKYVHVETRHCKQKKKNGIDKQKLRVAVV